MTPKLQAMQCICYCIILYTFSYFHFLPLFNHNVDSLVHGLYYVLVCTIFYQLAYSNEYVHTHTYYIHTLNMYMHAHTCTHYYIMHLGMYFTDALAASGNDVRGVEPLSCVACHVTSIWLCITPFGKLGNPKISCVGEYWPDLNPC